MQTVQRITKGSYVMRAPGYTGDGPLNPGDIGVVINDDGSSVPYEVRTAGGAEHWYEASALVAAPPGSSLHTATAREKVCWGVSSWCCSYGSLLCLRLVCLSGCFASHPSHHSRFGWAQV